MRALVAAPGRPANIELREVDEPDREPSEAIVEVRASSLNRGECSALRSAPDGWRPGWDVAGVIAEPSAEPSEAWVVEAGTRVIGWANGGAWAERVAVRADHLAELPEHVPFEVASTLPVAGLTAMGALAFVEPLEGRRVAITGAAGGVGRFAIQLAHALHADVTAVVGSPERGEGLPELGADHVVLALEPEGEPFDLILESAGGSSLAAALTRVSPDGTVVSFGNSSNEPTSFDPRLFYRRGRPTMRGYFVTHELLAGRIGSPRFDELVGLATSGRLRPDVDLIVPWTEAASAVTALLERRVRGKAVLTLGSS
ncbi:MAG TPA: zinc-binding dehydrogenase [Actinomycetota bacterium]|jgi:NADPH:quinone reductase-like Zn-dependent oxidoreductase